MIESREHILGILKKQMASDSKWVALLSNFEGFNRLHLAIFSDPYLGFIATGTKTIESRFSKNRIAPFEQAAKGDIILLKSPGRGVSGVCVVEKAWFYIIEPGTLEEIRNDFGPGICPATSDFWDQKSHATYCSLIWISEYAEVREFPINKKDRRGWVILK